MNLYYTNLAGRVVSCWN